MHFPLFYGTIYNRIDRENCLRRVFFSVKTKKKGEPALNNQFDYSQPNEQPPFMQGFDMMSPSTQKSDKKYAIASLCLGIASIVLYCCCCCLYYVAIVTSILAIIFAILSKNANGGKMSGMAIAGLILGIIGIILFLLIVVLNISGFFEEIMMETIEETYGMPYEDVLKSMGFGEYNALE